MTPLKVTPTTITPDCTDAVAEIGGAIIFSTPLTNELDESRLPPTHIGVRRVRASSKVVLHAFRNKRDDPQCQMHQQQQNETVFKHTRGHIKVGDGVGGSINSQGSGDCNRNINNGLLSSSTPVVYKIVGEDGIERRMTNKEKKELKLKLRKERNLARKSNANSNKKGGKHDSIQQNSNSQSLWQHPSNQQSMVTAKSCEVSIKNSSAPSDRKDKNFKLVSAQKRQYHQLEVNTQSLEEEISELRGEQKGIPPVLISSPMLNQAINAGILLPPSNPENKSAVAHYELGSVVVDDDLAKEWAKILKESMFPAEETRSRENMRPMAYQIVPEVWTRLRPPVVVNHSLTVNLAQGKVEDVLPDEITNLEKKKTKKHSHFTLSINNDYDAIDGNVHNDEDHNAQNRSMRRSINNTIQTSSGDEIEGVTQNQDRSQNQWMLITRQQRQYKAVLSTKSLSHSNAKKDGLNNEDPLSIVFHCLYNNFGGDESGTMRTSNTQTNQKLHISCGAKFGCDFLLYDGKRDERHAFAGLRVLSHRHITTTATDAINQSIVHAEKENENNNQSESGQPSLRLRQSDLLPRPSAYDLAGYVRGLNTAGKLALLAMVIPSDSLKQSLAPKGNSFAVSCENHSEASKNSNYVNNGDCGGIQYHVAFLDLALEKILSAPTHRKKSGRKCQSKRREVGLSLEKGIIKRSS